MTVNKDDRRSMYRLLMALVAITLVSNIIIVGIPSFYNHDELQKAHELQQHGFFNYLHAYLRIFASDRFETPVRPVGYLIWGIFLSPLPEHPWMVHLLDLLQHAVVVCLLFLVVRKVVVNQRTAFTAAAVFSFSPLATLSAGWNGAIFDRTYALFALATLYFFLDGLSPMTRQQKIRHLVAMAVFAALTVGSKETGLVLPAFLVIIWLLLVRYGRKIDPEYAAAGIGVATIPVAVYLGLRLKPLLVSLTTSTSTGYSTSINNVPGNALDYFTFPFLIPVTELQNIVFLPKSVVALALIAHLALVIFLGRRYGRTASGFYLAFYFLFLLPVLTLRGTGSHYLYGSGVVFSVALALLMPGPAASLAKKTRWSIAVAVLAAHTLTLQIFLYYSGTMMARITASLDAIATSATREEVKNGITIVAEPGSVKYILLRTVTGMTHFGPIEGVGYTVADAAGPPRQGKMTLYYRTDGRVYSR